MFSYQTRLRLRHTDAAGVLYFARQFDLIHEAYEAFLEHIGWSLNHMLTKEPVFVAIIRAESDYRVPLRLGEDLVIELMVGRVGHTSYVIDYDIFRRSADQRRELAGTAKTVHVAIDHTVRKKTTLPSALTKQLKAHLTTVAR